MRLFLLGAIVAVAGLVALLVIRDPDRTRSKNDRPQDNGATDPVEPSQAPLPDARAAPRDFVAECARRGPDAVERLLELLRGDDAQLLPRWVFRNGKLEGFPSLRAVYIQALRAIPGADATTALESALKSAASLEESLLIATALVEREKGGWAATVLERAATDNRPAVRAVQRLAVELAARKDPAATVDFALKTTPRGEDPASPDVVAAGLETLPIDHATATARQLLADVDVTPKAKALFVRVLTARPEIDGLATLTGLCERNELDQQMRTEAAYAAADAGGFRADLVAYQTAVARGDHAAAEAAKKRFEERLRMAERCIETALSVHLASSDDKRAVNLRKRLERQRKLFGQD